jgi:hypothetical protein
LFQKVVWHAPRFAPIQSILSCQYEPLQYPLLFPHDTPGWGLDAYANGAKKKFCVARKSTAGRSPLHTTNPNWPEIRSQLRPGQDVTDVNTCCGSVGPSICWPSKSPERIPAQGGFDLHTRSVWSDFKTEERITIKVRHEPPLLALKPPDPLHDLVKRYTYTLRITWISM